VSYGSNNVYVVLHYAKTHKQYEIFLGSLKSHAKQLGYLKAYGSRVAEELLLTMNSVKIPINPIPLDLDSTKEYKYEPQKDDTGSFGLG